MNSGDWALTEQFVYQELVCNEESRLFYWDPDTGHAQVDFILQVRDEIIPLEVKAEQNLKAKSLKVFSDRYHPRYMFRASLEKFFSGDNVTDIPLYAVSKIVEMIE